MKRISNFYAIGLIVLSLIASTTPWLMGEEEEGAEFQTWSYTLGGYIPEFFEPHEDKDPFAEPESGTGLRKHKEGIVSFFRQNGVEAEKIVYLPDSNALLITDTLENLAMHEVTIRALFRPDMQLRAIDGALSGLARKGIREGNQLDRIGLLGDTTFRAFHGEVRKLEAELASLPKEHQERENIEARLSLAKNYRDLAIELYIKALKEQKLLIERWQEEPDKTEQDAAPQIRPRWRVGD